MTEAFLHYIWQFQYFDKRELCTGLKEEIQVFQPGSRNSNAGPDFLNAKIKIKELEWRGSVELHIKASGWTDHNHSSDAAYENVILHVVWENDRPLIRTDGTLMPTLELKSRVDPTLWNQYKKLLVSAESIPCSHSLNKVDSVTRLSMLDKTVVRRLEAKSVSVIELLKKNNDDWEETCYQLLSKNFGFKVNMEPFARLSTALPYKILLKHADKPIQLEALLFGVAGFLEKANEDDYTRLLIREFQVLEKKYSLADRKLHKTQWRFLRLRPANFPTLRLAQLASIMATQKNLFSRFLTAIDFGALYKMLDIEQSDYWKTHYRFGKKVTRVSGLGESSIHNIIINTVVPLLVAYGKVHDEQQYLDKVTEWLQHIPAEINKITRQWKDLGFPVKSAFDSQALIELFNNFCSKRRCLECNIGASLVRPK